MIPSDSEVTPIYPPDGIREKVTPVAEKYGLRAVYLFGSYARGEAGEDSDVDLLIDREGSAVKSLLDLTAIQLDLEKALGKAVDIVTTQALARKPVHGHNDLFAENVIREEVPLYDSAGRVYSAAYLQTVRNYWGSGRAD